MADSEARVAELWNELMALATEAGSESRRKRLQSLHDRAEELAKTSGNQRRPLHAWGMTARLLGRWRDAEQIFRRVTELHPESLDGWLEWTWTLGQLDRLGEAEAAAKRAIEVDGTSPAAHGNLANVLVQQGKPIEALTIIRLALELDPENQLNQQIMLRAREALPSEAPQAERPWYKRWFDGYAGRSNTR